MWMTAICLIVATIMWLEYQKEKKPQIADSPWKAHERIRPLGGIGASLLPSLPPDLPPDGFVTPEQLKAIEALKNRIERKYSIRIRVFEVDSIKQRFDLVAAPYSPRVIEKHLTALTEWLKKYPPWYVANCGLRTIYLFDRWQFGAVNATGFLIGDDAIGITGDEEVLHHELWHVADVHLSPSDDNERWLRAKFGNAASDDALSLSGLGALQENLHLQERPFGYVSAYGKYAGVDEDQATTVAMLLSDPSTLAVLMRTEPPLRSSVRYVKAFFADRSENRMNETYWEDLFAGTTFTDRYWRE